MTDIRKNLTIEQIMEADKQFNEKEIVQVFGSDLEVDIKFRKTKISSAIAEIIENFEKSRIRGINIGALFATYVGLIIIKHFTSLEVPADFDAQLELLEVLVDNDYLEEIMNKLPASEVKKFFETVQEATERMNENMKELEKTFAEIKNRKELLSEELISGDYL